jgi:hypothetical protein
MKKTIISCLIIFTTRFVSAQELKNRLLMGRFQFEMGYGNSAFIDKPVPVIQNYYRRTPINFVKLNYIFPSGFTIAADFFYSGFHYNESSPKVRDYWGYFRTIDLCAGYSFPTKNEYVNLNPYIFLSARPGSGEAIMTSPGWEPQYELIQANYFGFGAGVSASISIYKNLRLGVEMNYLHYIGRSGITVQNGEITDYRMNKNIVFTAVKLGYLFAI